MADLLSSQLGVTQGRIAPTGWNVPDGTYVLCLGSDLPGVFEEVADGQGIQVEQTADIGTASTDPNSFIRFRARIRGPESMPGDWVWYFSFYTESLEHFWPIEPGKTFDLSQCALPTTAFSGTNKQYGFKLYASGTGTEVLEIPAVYIDDLQPILSSDPFTMTMQRPESGHTNVALDAEVTFCLTICQVSEVFDLSTLNVWVNEVPAIVDGSFVAPFDGPNSAIVDLANYHSFLTITLDPTVPFASQSTNTVLVHIIGDAGSKYAKSWSFVTEDTTAPSLLSAVARTMRVVRLTFSEDVNDENSTVLGSALNPANYLITGLESPYFVPDVADIVAVSNYEVDLIFAEELSPGILYYLSVSNVEDLVGNAIEEPGNVVQFRAAFPEQPAGRDLDIYGMFPAINRREDADNGYALLKFCACLQEVAVVLLASIDQWTDIFDIDRAPEWALDEMLKSMGNPFSFVLTENEKRRLLYTLWDIYSLKGTGIGIVSAVRFFFGVELELLQHSGTGFPLGVAVLGTDWELGVSTTYSRYSFFAHVGQTLTDTEREQITRVILYMKARREHFIGFVEPTTPLVPDHLSLGLSQLGTTWILH